MECLQVISAKLAYLSFVRGICWRWKSKDDCQNIRSNDASECPAASTLHHDQCYCVHVFHITWLYCLLLYKVYITYYSILHLSSVVFFIDTKLIRILTHILCMIMASIWHDVTHMYYKHLSLLLWMWCYNYISESINIIVLDDNRTCRC